MNEPKINCPPPKSAERWKRLMEIKPPRLDTGGTLDVFQANLQKFEHCADDAAPSLVNLLGLAGEAGEVLEKVKKAYRDGKPVDCGELAKELGDVLYYVAMVARDNGFRLSEIAEILLEKLEGREKRGTLSGEGDNR